MVQWLALGERHSQADFWEQTPRTFSLEMEAAEIREVRAHNARVSLAWNTAMLHRARRPSYKPLLARTQKDDLRQKLEALARWVAARGGTVIRTKPNGQ